MILPDNTRVQDQQQGAAGEDITEGMHSEGLKAPPIYNGNGRHKVTIGSRVGRSDGQ